MGQGKSNACDYLVTNPEVADALEATIRSIVFDDGVIPETRHSDEESTDDDEA